MECENAYIKKEINYILCRKADEPPAYDKRAICHSMCGHQRFCPKISACSLLPSWRGCTRRQENTPETAEKATENAQSKNASARTAKKKAAEKAPEVE